MLRSVGCFATGESQPCEKSKRHETSIRMHRKESSMISVLQSTLALSSSQIRRIQDIYHHIPWCVTKHGRRIHGRAPPWMRQHFAKPSIVRLVVEQALHAIHFRIYLVTICGQHGKPTAGINIVCPVSGLSNALTNFLSEFHKLRKAGRRSVG